VPPRSWRVRVQDILKASLEIELFINKYNSYSEFSEDLMAVRAVTACFSVIGEAVSFIPEEVKKKYPEVPWVQIRGMRNRISHEYFSIDETVLWRTAKDRIPALKIQIKKILDTEQD
jgi:uncharacterized protein with HEPN domain